MIEGSAVATFGEPFLCTKMSLDTLKFVRFQCLLVLREGRNKRTRGGGEGGITALIVRSLRHVARGAWGSNPEIRKREGRKKKERQEIRKGKEGNMNPFKVSKKRHPG